MQNPFALLAGWSPAGTEIVMWLAVAAGLAAFHIFLNAALVNDRTGQERKTQTD